MNFAQFRAPLKRLDFIMNFDLEVENLGQIRSGALKIRPITVLAGANGTGKSFLTKVLYSILNVVNNNAFNVEMCSSVSDSARYISLLSENLLYKSRSDTDALEQVAELLNEVLVELSRPSDLSLSQYFEYIKTKSNLIKKCLEITENLLKDIRKKPKKYASILQLEKPLVETLKNIQDKLNNGVDGYSNSLMRNFESEIKDNFQISSLHELVSFGSDETRINLDNVADIKFGKDGMDFLIQRGFIDEVSSLAEVVFYESPAYWKVREALMEAKNIPFAMLRRFKKQKNFLTGVPKYFYDLDSSLKEKSKNTVSTQFEEVSKDIESALDGVFVFENNEFYFNDYSSGSKIPKNLMSFGMTNLGVIHSLLVNNVITKGSFLIIDEPETNLHPEWQVLLMDVLLKLAKNEVNVVVATHSIDMLKAIEAGLFEFASMDEVDDFLSVSYFEKDGMMDFESDNPYEQLKEARMELSAPYERLLFR